MSAFKEETVQSVKHWNDELFSFCTTRDPGFRFKNGQFTMIGLEVNGRPLVRAYSMASANYDDQLEFFSIKVQNGPLTSRLQHIQPGDSILVGKKPTGTLVLDNLLPGKRLYLLCTGTGLAPFLSLIRDPETYERFDKVIVAHGCRHISDLAYHDRLSKELAEDEFLGEMVREKFIYYPTVTREPFQNHGRITDLMTLGQAVPGHPHAAAQPRRRPCYALRQPGDALGATRNAHLARVGGRQHGRARRFRDRKGFRRTIGYGLPLTLSLSRKGRGHAFSRAGLTPSPLAGEGWSEGTLAVYKYAAWYNIAARTVKAA